MRRQINLLLKDKDKKELLFWARVSALFTLWGGVLGVMFSILQARLFSAEGIGLMSMANTIIVLGSTIAWLGMQTLVVKNINQRNAQWLPGHIRNLYCYLLKINLPLSICIGLLIYLLRNRLSLEIFQDARLINILDRSPVFFPFIVVGNILLAFIKWYKKLFIYHSINKVARIFIQLLLLAWARYFFSSIKTYAPAIISLVTSLVIFFLTLPFLWNLSHQLPVRRKKSTKKIFETGIPMMLISLLFIVISQSNIIMLGIRTNATQIGVYQTSLSLSAFVLVGVQIINTILPQKIAELYYQKNTETLQSVIRLWTSIGAFAGLILSLIFIFFAKVRMWLFGEEFSSGSILLQILCLGNLVSVLSWPTGAYLNMTGRQNTLHAIVLVSAILNILLGIFLISRRWVIGAAISSTVSTIIRNIYAAQWIRKHDQIRTSIFL